ncbi:ASCH domain-containing protein [Serratia sp. NPDC078593]|uniref:ASCH domain-containing protein n=1 Tax=unclassified Serratia (in: enterobacteria) TaxID=2647522 RepID=UPI0037D55B54
MRDNILDRYPNAARWAFGDSSELADELLQLVLSGQKTATCCSYVSYQQEKVPAVGDYSVILNGQDEPTCVIRTLSLRLIRYCDVTADLAAKEGEGDKSLAFWQQGHRAFFTREGTFASDMWLVFEEFELVETW